jgi:hypothetical protein
MIRTLQRHTLAGQKFEYSVLPQGRQYIGRVFAEPFSSETSFRLLEVRLLLGTLSNPLWGKQYSGVHVAEEVGFRVKTKAGFESTNEQSAGNQTNDVTYSKSPQRGGLRSP